MTQQSFELDGHPISFCEAAFSGAFELSVEDAAEVTYDETIVFVVVARVGAPGHKTDRNGNLVRVNRLVPSAGKVAKGDMANEIAEIFDLEIQQKLDVTPPPPGPAAPPATSTTVQPPTSPSSSTPPPPAPAKKSPAKVPATVGASTAGAASTAGVAPGPAAAATIPSGTPVGTIPQTDDDELRKFLSES